MELPFATNDLLIGALAFVVGLVVSSAIVVAFVVLIPPDHFVAPGAGMERRLSSAPARIAYVIGKNTLGALLVIAGILLSVPGVPGQGLLTILVGVMLLDLPGKRGIERRIVGRPTIRRGIDAIRRRFGRAPISLERSNRAAAIPDPPKPTSD
jgi:hypothetical protein